MSLLEAAERFASLDRSQVVLDLARCLHSQDQFSECADCFEVCPAGAITIGKPPELDAAKCQSCLACLPACPAGAYRADDDVSSLLSCAAHVEGRSVELLCGLHSHPEFGEDAERIGIQLRGCLAGLGSAAYLSLSALGMEQIALRMDACRECRWAALAENICDHAAKAQVWLGAWSRGDQLICIEQLEKPLQRPFWNARNPPLSRRDLFRMLGRQGSMAMARAMESENPGVEKQPGRERRRLLSAMAHLPALESFPDTHLDGFAQITVSETCTACGACEKGCPTRALDFEKDEQAMTFRLSFSARECIDCGLCAHACAPAAISIESGPALAEVFGSKEPLLLQEGRLVRCERCRSWMAERPGVKFCPLCEFRRTHPFGSMLPPGLKSLPRKATQDKTA